MYLRCLRTAILLLASVPLLASSVPACSSGSGAKSTGDLPDAVQDSEPRTDLLQDGNVLFPDSGLDSDAERADKWLSDQTPGTDGNCGDLCIEDDQDTLDISGFGQLCQTNDDCAGNLCLWHMGDMRCSMYCMEECPVTFTCTKYNQYPDVTFICASDYPSLCLPCLASKDCPNPADRCLTYSNGQGSFCGAECGPQRACPEGYECKDAVTTEGDTVVQCVYSKGPICPCTSWATSHSLVTSCAVSNQSGTCVGTKSCGPSGWSECQAQNPQLELCFNQLDDDCNGQVDDPTLCNACDCGDGVCEYQCAESFDPGSGLDALLNCAVDCAVCGSGFCDPGESVSSCPQDCCGSCGDGVCAPALCGESADSCPNDCSPNLCGNGTCVPPENALNCPSDCPRGACGNATCEPGESSVTCAADCPASCGDCICQPSEQAGTCPLDCGFCGDGYCLSACPAMYAPENLASCFSDCCQPSCAAKECGTNGCGGSCGTCPQGSVCSDQGSCVCVPQCQGKECGGDGCGGECGQCSPGTKCDFGLCMTGCDFDSDCPLSYECSDGFCAIDLVDDARLVEPTQIVTIPGQASPSLSVSLLEAGITEGNGAGGIPKVQFGLSSTGWDPRLYPDQWVYITATYSSDQGGHDIYSISHTINIPGQYYFTFRASLDGNSFQYADKDGSLNGFDPASIGLWSVTPPPGLLSVSPDTASVLGGQTLLLTGMNFQPGLTLSLGGTAVAPTTVTSTTVMFAAPQHESGTVSIEVINPDGQDASLPSAVTFVNRFTPMVDGSNSEWNALLQVGTNPLISNWDASKNKLADMYASFDDTNLYILINGYCESYNYILCYIDMDYGASSGVAQMAWLSDNSGNGDLDDAFSNVLEVSVSGFGADWGFGSRGMASFAQGSDLAGSTYVGWRAMGTPYNLPWFQGSVKCSTNACEATIPLATVLPGGIPVAGTQVALFAKITDRYGDSGGISNQTVPEYYNTSNPKEIKAVADFLLRN